MIDTLLYTCVCVVIILIIKEMINSLVKETEDQRARIQKLATMLQVAEYQTGRPYYSSVGPAPNAIEHPEWLYNSMRDKLMERIHTEPVQGDRDRDRDRDVDAPVATPANT